MQLRHISQEKDVAFVFYANYLRLCNSVGKSPSAIAVELGFKKSTVTRWKSGGNPTDGNAQKIADYFGVSVSYLLKCEESSPLVTCEDCGLSYNSNNLSEVAIHNDRHSKWRAAVDKFGFCWSPLLREEIKGAARGKIACGDITPSKHMIEQINIFKALFSRSLEHSDYSLEHTDFSSYVAMSLKQQQWQESIPVLVYNMLVEEYGTMDGMPCGSYYVVKEKEPTQEGELTVKNPDIRMIARAGKKMTPEQAENLRKYAQYMFPEAFEDDDT